MPPRLGSSDRKALPSDLAEAAVRLLSDAQTSERMGEFTSPALATIREAAAAAGVALVHGEKGVWRTLAAQGITSELPLDAFAEALDRGCVLARGKWLVSQPLSAGSNELLAISEGWKNDPSRESKLSEIALLFGEAIASVRTRENERRRIERLESILKIVGTWRPSLDPQALTNEIAEASTKLLKAERASIFLWEKRSKTLIGRPALGVEGGELRIPDHAGVVGQVVQTGQPKRVDVDIEREQREVDRQTDKKLKFQTRSLLCVPLLGRNGETIGAFEMINKIGGNFTDDDLSALLELAAHASVALDHSRRFEHVVRSREQIASQAASHVELIGECPAIEALRGAIRRIADTDLAILVLGENGTGKEVVSQMIHYLSRRRNEPLVAVNCAAIAETLLESELFGHEKGAFTDAREARPGKFEAANRGTLFLDEIGDMSLAGQAKLLRVLEEKIVVRVGSTQPIPTDARLIAATNRNLAEWVRLKRFREDLYFRLNVVTLELPPLRKRGNDIVLLAEHFLAGFCAKAQRAVPQFTASAKKRLLAHDWPGNVRELRNLMERLAYLAPGDVIDTDDLAFILSPRAAAAPTIAIDLSLADATHRFQSDYVRKRIESLRGRMTEAAESLGLHRSNLYRKMRQLGLDVDDDEPGERSDS